MRKAWCIFFMFWPVTAIVLCWSAPANNWWFPGKAVWSIGAQIDDLFYLILLLTSIVFVATQFALGYVLWRGAEKTTGKALFAHGSHNLEVIWTIVPAGVLLFISLYQMDVLARLRVKSKFPVTQLVAEVTARQFEWRIRYPAPGKSLQPTPQPDDLYTVNDLHVPTGKPLMIRLRSGDVQHGFGLPHLRIMQDAVPGLVIPVWFEVDKVGTYEIVCKELCGWGHYKMRGQMVAQRDDELTTYYTELQRSQFDDGSSQALQNAVAQHIEDQK